MLSNHLLEFFALDQATPLQFFAIAGIFLLVASTLFGDYLNQWGFSMQQKEIEVDEDLPNFFKAVRLSQADEVVLEAQNIKDNYGIEIEDPRVIERLDETEMPKRSIGRTPWYQVLSNPEYSDAFYYIGAFVEEREKLIKDADEEEGNDCEQSDIILILLNLGAIPDEVAKSFDFRSGFQADFLVNMKKHQDNFYKEHGVKWGHMTEETIERYLNFKHLKQGVDNQRVKS